MSRNDQEHGETGTSWLYAQAQQFPLLTVEEEGATDRCKWEAVTELQRVIVEDLTGRDCLRHWTTNLLENPPGLDTFGHREYYNLLKREQGELLAKGRDRKALLTLNKRLARPPHPRKDLDALTALNLTGPLVTGLTEVLLCEPEASAMSAALSYWRRFWPESQRRTYFIKRADTGVNLRKHLNRYYDARSRLITHNLRLVYAIAAKVNGRGSSYEDLVQGGIPGLIRAAEKFQYTLGYRFSTYAYNWIKQSIQQQLEDSQGILRYPASVHENISRLYREHISYQNTNGRQPDARSLAQKLDMDRESFERLREVNNFAVPLDARVGDPAEGLSLAETLRGTPEDEASRVADNQSLGHCLMRTLQGLKPVEREIVSLRWGLANFAPLTRVQVADRLQVSTEWVRQLENSALEKLRRDAGLAEAYGDYLASG